MRERREERDQKRRGSITVAQGKREERGEGRRGEERREERSGGQNRKRQMGDVKQGK